MNNQYVFEHDLKSIFKQVWGYNAFPYFFKAANKVENALFGKDTEETEYDFAPMAPRAEYSSKGPAYYAYNENNNEVFLPIWLIRPDGSKFLLQNTISSFTNQKTIVETPMVNWEGSVKEEISFGDWIINIKGIMISPNLDYPEEQMNELNEMYRLKTSLGIENVRSAILLEAGENVVIKSLKFQELKGMNNIQPFEMELVQDIKFELYIK